MAARSEKLTFTGAGGQALAARLDHPAGPARAWALFAHCFTCSKDTLAASRIATALAARGIGVLRFDFTGLGGSEGEFANTTFSSNLADLEAAARFMEEAGRPVALLVGHSLGGTAVLAAAPRLASVRAVAAINAPSDPSHVAHRFAESLDVIRERGQAEVSLAGRPFTIKASFLEDAAEQRVLDAAATMRKALLIFHAPLDAEVGIDNAARIYAAARHPKSFVSLDGADHLLSRSADATYVAEVLSAWAGRHLPAGPEGEGPAEAEPGSVIVRETRTGRFTQEVLSGRHQMIADEPAGVGGDDAGPGPYEYLLAALGACTSMTIRMYADRKGVPLDRVTVRLHHEKRHVDDCENCETPTARIDVIDRAITLDGALDADQRARLLEIADRCPVHRTLHSVVRVNTVEG